LCREPSELGLTGFALEESFSKGPRKWRPRPKKSTGFSSALAKFEGRRKQRIEAAEGAVNRSEAEYELSRLQIIQRVKLAYCSFQVRICVECLPALWNLVDERRFEPPPSSLRTT
jgi:hypothetical protein